jgi:outer membrane receptor protein involved in Fe transport
VFDKAFGRATDRPVIRGQGNVLAGVQFGVEAGAAYFVDGIYYNGDIQSFGTTEIERIEVIRGPQSALYGRNTFSGAINFITRSPSDEFGMSGKAAIDNMAQDYSLRIEGPVVGETLTGSLSMRYYDLDGQWTNQLTGEDNVGAENTRSITGVLEWNPTENQRLRVRGAYSEDDDKTRPLFFQDSTNNNCYPGSRSIAYFATSGSTNANQYYCGEINPRQIYLNTTAPVINFTPNPAIPLNAVVLPSVAGVNYAPGSTRTYSTDPGIAFSGVARDLYYWSGLYEWDISGSGYVLSASGAYRDEDRKTGSDSDFTSLNLFSCDPEVCGFEAANNNTFLDAYEDYSVELKIASPLDRRFRWMLGGYFYELDQKVHDINFFYPDGQPNPQSISSVFNESIFGLVEFDFATNWTATLEGRYMWETKQLSEVCTTAPAPCFATVNGPGVVATSFEGEWTKFTPRVTLKWQANPNLNIYAVYAEGVKPGGFNGSAGLLATPPQVEYGEETSYNYELGVKSAWLDGRLIFNVAAYYIEDEDIQLTTPVVRLDGSPVTSIATNQGDGEITGVEVESTWQVIDELTLTLGYALADTEFTSGCDDFQWTLTSGGGNNALRQGAYVPAAPGTGGTNLNGLGDCSIVGNQFPLSAKNTASFAADWRQPLTSDYELFINADVSYTDKRPVQVHNLAFVPEAILVGARIGVSTDQWTASLYGRNLTNEDAPLVATRWLQNPYLVIPGNGVALASAAQLAAAGLPAYPPVNGIPTTGANALNNVAAYNLPRGFFASLRQERQIGIEFTFGF